MTREQALGYERWSTLGIAAAYVLTGIVVLTALAGRLNLLGLGGEAARSLGAHVAAVRWVVLVTTSLIVAGVVSLCGFVGYLDRPDPPWRNTAKSRGFGAAGAIGVLVWATATGTVASPPARRRPTGGRQRFRQFALVSPRNHTVRSRHGICDGDVACPSPVRSCPALPM